MLEQEKQTSTSIQVFQPKDIPEDRYEELGLLDLMRGYQFTDGLSEQAQMEYGEEDGKERYIFLAMQGEKAIASLVVDMPHTPGNISSEFYTKLQEVAPNEAEKVKDLSVCDIHGIVKSPDAKEKGLANKFLSKMVDTLHPAIVVSRTKTPAYTAAFSQTLAQYGYRIWYGDTEVTQEDLRYPQPFIDINPVRDAHGRRNNGSGPTFVSRDILPSYVPNVDNFTKAIQEAYRPIISAQELENQQALSEKREPTTAVFQCIAICVGN